VKTGYLTALSGTRSLQTRLRQSVVCGGHVSIGLKPRRQRN
jgi:hypothetical protein